MNSISHFHLVLMMAALPSPQGFGQIGFEARARTFVADVLSQNTAGVTAVLNAEMALALTPDRFGQIQEQLKTQLGDFQSIASAEIQAATPPHEAVIVTCVFSKTTVGLRVVFDADGRVAGLTVVPPAQPWSPPSYADPQKFHERTLTLGSAPWQLPAVLTIPNGVGPFPAVVLVHGSGPSDEDETVGGNKVLKDLAWGLASYGIAVLRYQKRTYVHARAMMAQKSLTVMEETVIDARLGIELLAQTPEVNPSRIAVIGHSLGGMLAPRIALDSAAAGIVILAGNSRPIEDLLVEQFESLAGRGLAPASAVDDARKSREEIQDPNLEPDTVVHFVGVSIPGSYWLDLRAYSPTATAQKLKIPIMVLRGERDYQVAAADLDGWKKALADHRNVTVKSYPALNHFFESGSGIATPDEYFKPGHVDPEVIHDIAMWIASALN